MKARAEEAEEKKEGAVVFWRRRKYFSTSSRPANDIAATIGGYYQCLSISRCGFILANQWATLWWKPPRVQPIRGFITHVSYPKKSIT